MSQFKVPPPDFSRRAFLKGSGTLAAGSWLAATWPAILALSQVACQRKAEDAAFEFLSAAEAAGLNAVAEQIMPGDETPGARAAGVIWFIDGAVGGFMSEALGMLRDGLADLDARAAKQGVERFTDLGFEQQTSLLRSIEDSPFFGTMHFLTVAGMFALPKHGGNRDKLGWELLGFEDRHAWAAPFGSYDEPFHPDSYAAPDTVHGDEHGR